MWPAGPVRKRHHARRRWKAREGRKGGRQRRRTTPVASRVAQRHMARCRTRADARQRPAWLPSSLGTRTGRHACCQSTSCAEAGRAIVRLGGHADGQTGAQADGHIGPLLHGQTCAPSALWMPSRSWVRRSTCPICKQATGWVCSRTTLTQKRVAIVYAAARHANTGFDWER